MVDHAIMSAFFREVGKIAAAPRLRGAALAHNITEGIEKARGAVESTHEAFRAHLHSINPGFKVRHNMSEAARAKNPHLDLRKTNPELYTHDTYKAHEGAVAHLKNLEEAAKKHENLLNSANRRAKAPEVQTGPVGTSHAPTGEVATKPTAKKKGTASPEATGEEGAAAPSAPAAAPSAPAAAGAAAKPGFFQRNAGTLVAGSGIAALGGGGGYAASRIINRPQQ